MGTTTSWRIFQGSREPHDGLCKQPDPPPWRPRRGIVTRERAWPKSKTDDGALPPSMLQRGGVFHATEHVVDMVNAALYLRRPLLVTGQPGSGKSSLVDAVAYELRMGPPLRWAVTSKSTLRDALYQYDAIGRLQERKWRMKADVGDFLTLGALGTALLPTAWPRALLIDEIDKGDIDLPNDLLNVFEEGEFEIPELRRLGADTEVSVFTSDPLQPRAMVKGGVVAAYEFPLMILTSNGEREFPAPFLRRCLRLEMPNPTSKLREDDNDSWQLLDKIIDLHFTKPQREAAESVIDEFKNSSNQQNSVAMDQLLNAIYFVMSSRVSPGKSRDDVIRELLRALVATGS